MVCRTLSADGVSSIAALISRTGLAGAQRAVVDPVDHQLSLPEVPMTVHLHELIQVRDRSDHQTAMGTIDFYVMRKAVRDPGCGVLGPGYGALTIEMGGRLVRLQIPEYGAQAVAAADFLRGDCVAAIHINEKLSVRHEERHLAPDVPAVCARGIRVDKLTNGGRVGS